MLYNCMDIESLKKLVLEAFATAKGVRTAAMERPHHVIDDDDDQSIEAQDTRPEMEDEGETVRVSTDGDDAKVTRTVSGRVRRRRAEPPEKGGLGAPEFSDDNPRFRTRVVKAGKGKGKGKERSSTELIRGARLALAEKVLEAVSGDEDLTPAERLKKGAAAMGVRFDQITSDAERAADLIRKEADRKEAERKEAERRRRASSGTDDSR